ncbi:MAG TPA: hypothetical protein VNT52_08375, partial [Acidimicrobiales bacterium]|nr:hypothetical protein [Acidimicrobiales bacterium]
RGRPSNRRAPTAAGLQDGRREQASSRGTGQLGSSMIPSNFPAASGRVGSHTAGCPGRCTVEHLDVVVSGTVHVTGGDADEVQ